jgi:hypothetical protein
MSKIDDLLQHELGLQRVATQLINKGLYPSLEAAYKAIRLILLDSETITSPTKLRTVERAINKAVNEALEKGWGEYSKELTNIAVYDSSFYAQLIGGTAATLKVPGKRSIADYVQSALMSLSSGQVPKVGLWADFVQENISGYAAQVNNLVKAGYVNNATVQQTARTIKQFSDGLARQQAETLARTGLRHYTEAARDAMAEDNADIIDARVYVATFDNRTTLGCASLHLKEWKLSDDSYVRLPRHYNCRSVYIYRLKGQTQYDLLSTDRPAIGSGASYPKDGLAKKKYRELPDGTFEEYTDQVKPKYRGRRDSENGRFDVEQVKASTGFGTWLKRQDEAFVVDVLGKKRAELFLKGGLPLDRMSDGFGRQLTLAELIKREKAAFTRAGLSG